MAATFKEFTGTAKTLAKNPLGIIALFIVLIYGFGCLVVGFGGDQLIKISNHPLMWFLAIFPFIVLIVFAYLVACHHKKLYGPGDYDKTSEFTELFDESDIPKAIRNNDKRIATSDGVDPQESVEPNLLHKLDDRYLHVKTLGFCVLHQSEVVRQRTQPRSGLYRVRVWIENFMDQKRVKDIKQVTYRVWDDFGEKLLSTTSAESNFDLWLKIYGEFPVSVLIELKNGEHIIIERYLDLQGRPPD